MVTGHGRGTTEQGVLLSLHLGRQAKMANSCGSGRPFKNLGTELALQVPNDQPNFGSARDFQIPAARPPNWMSLVYLGSPSSLGPMRLCERAR